MPFGSCVCEPHIIQSYRLPLSDTFLVVFVVDKDNKVVHTEVSSDILEEPNYDNVLAKVDELLG
jgi:peroxiredoxin